MTNEQQEILIGELWEKDNSTHGGQGINPSAYRIGALAMYRHLNSKPSGLKVGDKVVLDVEHNNSSVVTIRAMAKYYSTVTDGNYTWQVMTNRLSAIVSAASTPTLLEEKAQPSDETVSNLLKWLNVELDWHKKHAESNVGDFHRGALQAMQSVASKILELRTLNHDHLASGQLDGEVK